MRDERNVRQEVERRERERERERECLVLYEKHFFFRWLFSYVYLQLRKQALNTCRLCLAWCKKISWKYFLNKKIFSVVWLYSRKYAKKWFPMFGLYVKWLLKNNYNLAYLPNALSLSLSLSQTKIDFNLTLFSNPPKHPCRV